MKLKLILLITLVTFFVRNSFAQEDMAEVKGVVLDQITKESVIGASVFIEGTSKGTATDLDGKFLISSIKPGSYKLKISFIGYSDKIINLKLGSNQQLDLGFINISEDKKTLAEFNVVSEKVVKSEISMISAIKSSTEVVSGISQAQIRRIPESDASGVMKRISGVSIYGDNFMVVRGLSERYNQVTINGVTAPSFEIDRNSFSFDVVPNAIVENIVVYKTASPELFGNFSGGLAKIITNGVPSKDYVRLKYGVSYKSNTTFENFEDQYYGASGLGYDDNVYENPFNLDYGPQQAGDFVAPEDAIKYTKEFNNRTMAPVESRAPLDKAYSLEWGKRLQISDKITLGNFTYLGIKDTRTRRSDYKTAFYLDGEATATDAQNFFKTGFLDDHVDIRKQQFGGITNFSLRLGNNHSIDFKNFYNHLSRGSVMQRTGFRFNSEEEDSFDDDIPEDKNFLLIKNFKELYTTQLSGKHDLFKGAKIDWLGGYYKSQNAMPDLRVYNQMYHTIGLDTVIKENKDGSYKKTFHRKFVLKNNIPLTTESVEPTISGRNFFNVDEKQYTAALNLSYQLDLTDKWSFFKPEIKIGGWYEKKTRNYLTQSYGLQVYLDAPIPKEQWEVMSSYELFSDQVHDKMGMFLYREEPNYRQIYNAHNENFATYLALKIPLSSKINLNGGLRLEDNTIFFEANEGKGTNKVGITLNDITLLPSANLVANLSEFVTLRGGYFKNITRPIFREISPTSYYDFFEQQVNEGNLLLKNSIGHNFDLRLETYPNLGEIFSLAGFYKNIDKPIADATIKVESDPVEFVQQVINVKNGYVYGLEFELRKGLGNIFASENMFLENTYFVFNTTLSKGRVEFPDEILIKSGFDKEITRIANNDVKIRKLIGHSEVLVNSGLYFNEIQKLRGAIALFYNVTGPRIIQYGFGEGTEKIPDTYEMHRHQLDFTVSKNFGKHLQLSFKIKDILNEPYKRIMYPGDSDGLPRKGDNLIFNESYREGAKYTFQVTLDL